MQATIAATQSRAAYQHCMAAEEAETDEMKRALMTFDNPPGLMLCTKRQREVIGSATAAPNANPSSRPVKFCHGESPNRLLILK